MTDRLESAYNTLKVMYPAFVAPCPNASTVEEHQLNLMELNNYAYREIRKTNRGFPAGYWYFATLTSKPEDTKEDILKNHQKVLNHLKDQVVHAVLEKSNIYHIHYMLCLKDVKRNLDRDVRSMCQRIFKTEHCITSLKRWNGACKYILKRDYDAAKADTFEEILKEGIVYEESKGYSIKA